MGKAALGIVCFLVLLFLLPLPSAFANEAKAAPPQKKGKNKAQPAPKAKPTVVHKVSAKRQHKRSPPAATRRDGAKKAVRAGKRRAVHQRVAYRPAPPVLSAGDLAGLNLTRDPLMLHSNVALVLDQSNAQVLFEKNSDVALPIASLTKLMTALVVVEAQQNMAEVLEVTEDDIDRIKHTSSRLPIGAKLSRADMLHIALMSSENRAASALGRHFPGGLPAFVAAMNAKAKALGMTDTHYVEPTGLSSQNVASARDLAKLVIAAHEQPLLAQYSTQDRYAVNGGRHMLQYVNSNRLIGNADWEIGLQKTGYISEAGRCLVMQVTIEGRAMVMVFLDADGSYARFADASRLRKWVLSQVSSEAGSDIMSAEKQN
jgi:D-alanyl-D-alanine endopeptidase (penicillin-binding protein 7)